MTTRKDLHSALVAILGNSHVYYQPPANIRIQYPAIVYSKEKPVVKRADDKTYKWNECYTLVAISSDPDNTLQRRICELPMTDPGKRYVADNLYHDPITIYL